MNGIEIEGEQLVRIGKRNFALAVFIRAEDWDCDGFYDGARGYTFLRGKRIPVRYVFDGNYFTADGG